LPEAAASAAYKFVTGPLLDNPDRIGKQLQPPLADRYSARRGTYLSTLIQSGPRSADGK
jgi:mRNA interferase RelE/StbE